MFSKENRLIRILRYYYLKFKRLNDNPRALAGGTAIGVLVGLTPTVPLHTPLIILLTFITNTSVVAAILVSWVVFNPVTIVPIYYVSIVIGSSVTPFEVSYEKIQDLIHAIDVSSNLFFSLEQILALGYEAIVVLFVGGFIFSLPFAVVSYYCALRFFHLRRQKKRFN